MAALSIKKLTISASAAVLSMAYVVPSYASSVDDPWLIRLRAVNIVPDESADIETIGGDVNISNRVVPELDISYFFTENIAAELILATNPHDVSVSNTALGDVDLGGVSLLPPTLNLQYHFAPRAAFRPYIGAGVNYTFFYDNDPGDFVSVNYDNTFGLSLQAGVDIPVNETYFLNFDLKKVFLGTDVTVDAGAAGVVGADVDIDPWIFGVGVGRRF